MKDKLLHVVIGSVSAWRDGSSNWYLLVDSLIYLSSQQLLHNWGKKKPHRGDSSHYPCDNLAYAQRHITINYGVEFVVK